jgi:hypothetical protein
MGATLLSLALSIFGVAPRPAPSPLPPHGHRPRDSRCVVYTNTRYGFRFCLPQSWAGFTVDTSRWDGRVLVGGSARPPQVLHGPELFIRHPLWTADHPRQDIPILIFTHAQWRLVERQAVAVSAAPIGPSELGRNTSFVFALPPRYDFAFLTGWQEVRDILDGHPIQPL